MKHSVKRFISMLLVMVMLVSVLPVNALAAGEDEPTVAAEATTATEPTKAAEPVVPAETTVTEDPTEPVDPATPTETAAPVDSTEATDPADPTETTASADPMEPEETEETEAVEETDPTEEPELTLEALLEADASATVAVYTQLVVDGKAQELTGGTTLTVGYVSDKAPAALGEGKTFAGAYAIVGGESKGITAVAVKDGVRYVQAGEELIALGDSDLIVVKYTIAPLSMNARFARALARAPGATVEVYLRRVIDGQPQVDPNTGTPIYYCSEGENEPATFKLNVGKVSDYAQALLASVIPGSAFDSAWATSATSGYSTEVAWTAVEIDDEEPHTMHRYIKSDSTYLGASELDSTDKIVLRYTIPGDGGKISFVLHTSDNNITDFDSAVSITTNLPEPAALEGSKEYPYDHSFTNIEIRPVMNPGYDFASIDHLQIGTKRYDATVTQGSQVYTIPTEDLRGDQTIEVWVNDALRRGSVTISGANTFWHRSSLATDKVTSWIPDPTPYTKITRDSGEDYGVGWDNNTVNYDPQTGLTTLAFDISAYHQWDASKAGNGKKLNKITLTYTPYVGNPIQYTLTLPAESAGATAETQSLNGNFTARVTCIDPGDDTANTGMGIWTHKPQYVVSITARNGAPFHGNFTVAVNFKDRQGGKENEIWALKLHGVLNNRISNTAGNGNIEPGGWGNDIADPGPDGFNALYPNGSAFWIRDINQDTRVTIPIDVAGGFSTHAEDYQVRLQKNGTLADPLVPDAGPNSSGNQYYMSGNDIILIIGKDTDSAAPNGDDVRISIDAIALRTKITYKLDGGNFDGNTNNVVQNDVRIGYDQIDSKGNLSADFGCKLLPTEPKKEGCAFTGWKLEKMVESDDDQISYAADDLFITSEDNVKAHGADGYTFVAQWVENEKTRSVDYDVTVIFIDQAGNVHQKAYKGQGAVNRYQHIFDGNLEAALDDYFKDRDDDLKDYSRQNVGDTVRIENGKEVQTGGTVYTSTALTKLLTDQKADNDFVLIYRAAANPGLTVVKSTTATATKPGDTIPYELVITNTGNVPLTDVVITDPLLTEDNVGTNDGANWNGTNWVFSELPVGASKTITYTYTVPDSYTAQYVTNTATVNGKYGNENVTGSSDEVKVPVISLQVDKALVPGTYEVGSDVSFTITVTNTSDVDYTNVLVTEDANVIITTEGNTTNTYTIPSLAAGASVALDAEYRNVPAGTFVNNVTGEVTKDGVTVTDDGTASVTVQDLTPGLDITKEITSEDANKDGKYGLNEKITYKITVTNTGKVALTGVHVVDNKIGLDETIDLGIDEDNKSHKFTGSYTVTESDLGTTIHNVATATHGDLTPEDSADADTDPKAPALIVVKETLNKKTEYALNDQIEYQITVTNTGNVTLKNVIFNDALLNIVNRNLGDMLPDAEQVITGSYTVTEADIRTGSVYNQATAKAEDGTEDEGHVTDNTVSVTKGLTVEKKTVDQKAKYSLGDTIKYEIVVTNTGNQTLTDVTVTDDLTHKTWDIGTLLPGESSGVLETSYVVTEADLGKDVVNVADAEGTDPDGNKVTGTDDATDNTDDVEKHLVVNKTTTSTDANNDGKYGLNEIITYEITVTNTGNVTLKDITVTDELTGGEWAVKELAPGATSTVFKTSHKVTEDDIKEGKVLNMATASVKDDPDVPVTPGEKEDPTDSETKGLKVDKKTTSKPANGRAYALGETITYQITVKNTGNVTLENITVTNELTGDTWTVAALAPDEVSTAFKAEHEVTEADIKAGSVVNEATASVKDDPDVPVIPGKTEDPTDGSDKGLKVEKITTSTPANGKTYALGETITYEITVKNTGNVTLKDITVTDELTGGEWAVKELAPGATSTVFKTSHKVTEDDIKEGKVLNMATASVKDDPDVPVTPGEKEDPTDSETKGLKVDKKTTSKPANGRAYALGETITYQITVTNTGNMTLENITVTDDLTGNTWTVESLAPGATSTAFRASHQVTEADIQAGSVVNVATAKTDDPDVPVIPGKTEDPTDGSDKGLKVEKITTSTPANGKTYALGETITYEITVKNTGNVTLENITVTDDLTGNTWTVESLAPGATSEAFEAEHEVTEDDIKAGSVVNEATASVKDDPDVPVIPGKTEDDTDDIDVTLNMTKTADLHKAVEGDKVTYTIAVTNSGNVTYTNVVVTDGLKDAKIVKVTAPNGYTDNKDGSVTLKKLGVGETATIIVEYTVTAEDAEDGNVHNVANAKGDPIDDPENPENPKVPQGEAEEDVPTEPVDTTLVVTKKADRDTAKVGEKIIYTITVKNEGNVDYKDVVVADQFVEDGRKLPEGAEITKVTVKSSYIIEGNTVTLKKLEVGETATITAEYTVKQSDEGTILNVAVAKGETDRPGPGPEGESEEVPSKVLMDLVVKKEWKKDSILYRPKSIKVTLYADGKADQTVEITSQGGWKYTFKNLPNDGTVYTVEEVEVPGGYFVNYSELKDASITITNTKRTKPGDGLLQTGQLNWPIPVLALLGVSMITGGAALTIGKKKDKYEG